ncbi:MAG: AAA family ATPase [Pseudomonadota bacterium]
MPAHPHYIAALLHPEAYPHPVRELTLRETHISWVILTGDYAYKIKKPLNLGFLDFSTVERRRHFCHEEIRLNRRLAPELYLDVVAICEDRFITIGGAGKPIEYAVRMRQFSQDQMLEAVIARHALTEQHLDVFAAAMAEFHARIARSDASSPYGTLAAVTHPQLENFTQIAELGVDAATAARLASIQQWTEQSLQNHAALIAQRHAEGFVRECHGDMHLGNMLVLDDAIRLFDCIEFNPNLYWIDVISEVAFFIMDLQHRGLDAWAFRFLNGYLQHTGDYRGLALLPLYLCYRAMVRAKVSKIRQGQSASKEAQSAAADFSAYLDLAARHTQPTRPVLIITHGLSGSGKSTYAQPLASHIQAIHIRSDIERKRLFGLTAQQQSFSTIEGGIYTRDASARTYQHLVDTAHTILASGYSVIVDATFLKREQRDLFGALAKALGIPWVILHFAADKETLKANIRARLRAGGDASEADLAVLEQQLAGYQELGPDETNVIDIDFNARPSYDDCHAMIQKRIGA